MNVLFWIFFGLVAGVIAKLLTPGRDPGDCIVTMLLGVLGAFIGGFLSKTFTHQPYVARSGVGGLAVAVGGAIIVLLIYRLLTGDRAIVHPPGIVPNTLPCHPTHTQNKPRNR